MKIHTPLIACLFLFARSAGAAPVCPDDDILYVGDPAQGVNPPDPSDDAIVRLGATSGEFLGYLQPPSGNKGKNSLNGPMGLVIDDARMFVVNQNVQESKSGEVRVYDLADGSFELLLEPTTKKGPPNSPFGPRGLVLQDDVLYVADVTDPGRLTTWDAETGEFLGDLALNGYAHPFRPRGLVFGPDGFLYVAVTALPNLGYGAILRFDIDPAPGALVDIVYECDPAVDPDCDLHRPEGIVFGPDGKIYVTSFRLNALDIDRIMIFDLAGGPPDEIPLDQVGQPRAFAQALLFGPDERLYVPITGDGPDTGSVRIYDVVTKTFDLLVGPPSAGGPLVRPWYLTFENTDPATLAYEPATGCD